MMAFVILVVAIVAFLAGYGLSGLRDWPKLSETRIEIDKDNEKIMQEYRNFLSYDGTEQP